jgi:hypothetical protein
VPRPRIPEELSCGRGRSRTSRRPLIKRLHYRCATRPSYQGQDLHLQHTGSEPASSADWDTLACVVCGPDENRTRLERSTAAPLPRCVPDQMVKVVSPGRFELPARPSEGCARSTRRGEGGGVAPGVRLARTTSGLTGRRLCFEATLEKSVGRSSPSESDRPRRPYQGRRTPGRGAEKCPGGPHRGASPPGRRADHGARIELASPVWKTGS